jgi:hypothetical protein
LQRSFDFLDLTGGQDRLSLICPPDDLAVLADFEKVAEFFLQAPDCS